MSQQRILLEHRGASSQLTLNRPDALNAIDSALAREFLAALREVAERPQSRVLLLQAAGRAFMAGGDISQFADAPDSVMAELVEPMAEAVALLHRLPIPVIGCARGAAAGAGMSLLLACDLVIGSESLKLSFAYGKLAASCDLGISWVLPRLVGLRKALEIALLGEPLDAAAALRLGLINQVVAEADLQAAGEQLAQRLAATAAPSTAALKQLLRQSLENDLSQQLRAESEAFARCMASAEFEQAVKRFLKRD